MSTFRFELFHFLKKQERFVTAGYQMNFVKSQIDLIILLVPLLKAPKS